jgi:hypothetical protein
VNDEPRLVPTSVLARVLGLSDRTIQRYRQLGVLKPDVVSPGGHARWNVEKVARSCGSLPSRAARKPDPQDQREQRGEAPPAMPAYFSAELILPIRTPVLPGPPGCASRNDLVCRG